jgi:hypothetical protein
MDRIGSETRDTLFDYFQFLFVFEVCFHWSYTPMPHYCMNHGRKIYQVIKKN